MLEARETNLIAGNVLFMLFFKKGVKCLLAILFFHAYCEALSIRACHFLLARGSCSGLMVSTLGSSCSSFWVQYCFPRKDTLSLPLSGLRPIYKILLEG